MSRWDPTLFQGTASYYARYRPQYPHTLVAGLVERLHLHPGARVLDLGCGTGHIAVPLSRSVNVVVGLDPDEEMLAEARWAAAEAGSHAVAWIRGLAEALPFRPEAFDACTIAAAFHWTERDKALEEGWRVLRSGGLVAVISSATALRDVQEQRGVGAAVEEVQQRWFGPERPAGAGVYWYPTERHEEVMARSRFGPPHRLVLPWTQYWDVDHMIGLLFSTSFPARRLLGDRIGGYEEDLRQAILRAEPTGQWRTDTEIEVLLGTKHEVRGG